MKTLLIIDVQNDFLPGGSLAVREGNQIIPLINELIPHYDHVVATQDYHPADHSSFAENNANNQIGDVIKLGSIEQILWPAHCVQGTLGSAFANALNTSGIDCVFQKGTDVEIDSYSGFYDNGHLKDTGLANYLRELGVTELHIVGLATDYCVKYTALDAVAEGFNTTIITDACRGVNISPTDTELAIAEMQKSGVISTTTDDLLGDITTLYRPVGPEELAILQQTGFTQWPPRLPEQPIFYPVTTQAYAEQITVEWNVKDSGSGYVTRFQVKRPFLKTYNREIVGGKQHEELWIPAEDIDELNANLVGKIEVIKSFESVEN